jgi:hypothetical protein
MIKTSESWAWARGTIWDKERIEPQLSNVLADWVWGKWGLKGEHRKRLNTEDTETEHREHGEREREEIGAA